MDTYLAVQNERLSRAKKLGRIWDKQDHKVEITAPTSFFIAEGNEQFDDPFKQAEYAYSLIETEVNVNEVKYECYSNTSKETST